MKILYVYTARGCSHCEEAKPVIEDFKRLHWSSVSVIYADVTNVVVSIPGLDPRMTPTYALLDEKFQLVKKHEGVLSREKLESFVYGERK